MRGIGRKVCGDRLSKKTRGRKPLRESLFPGTRLRPHSLGVVTVREQTLCFSRKCSFTAVNSFALDGLNCGVLPVYVRFGARKTRMQWATFSGSDTARGAGDRDYLLRGQFLLFYFGSLLQDKSQNGPLWNLFR